MSASGFFPLLDRKGTVYLFIVVCKWQFDGAQETQGVFAQKLELTNLDPVESVARVIFCIMKESGLPVIPLQVTVIKDDQVVRAWASTRDFLEEDVWDKVEELTSPAAGGVSRTIKHNVS